MSGEEGSGEESHEQTGGNSRDNMGEEEGMMHMEEKTGCVGKEQEEEH